MRIAVLIPDRNDRPKFLANCWRMMEEQTLKPVHIEIINNEVIDVNADGYVEPGSQKCDITFRYRTGYDKLRNKGFDLIAFIENDDWYSPHYLETMVAEWNKRGQPDIIGTDYTIYYQLEFRKFLEMNHKTRSSAMSTLIRPDLNFPWCKDEDPFTDMWIWNQIRNKVTFKPEKHICIGMKHGVGLCGGQYHRTRLERYKFNDPNMSFLKSVLDENSFKFYSTYFPYEV
jgi:glycosyltransferase involved in cell wall biosynthesis